MCPDQVELRHLLESLQQMQAGWQQTEAAARAQLLADKESSDKEWAGPRGGTRTPSPYKPVLASPGTPPHAPDRSSQGLRPLLCDLARPSAAWRLAAAF